MIRALVAGSALLAGLAAAGSQPAFADSDQAFFERVSGHWVGPGEIVAGKYKGTKFVCDLSGATHATETGLALDGSCRVGVFSQKMSAVVSRGGASYKGAFLDGAVGKGLDIISGTRSGDRMVFGLDRKQLKGAMVARLENRNALNITVSVRVAEELVPVIGMRLKREAPAEQHGALSK